MATARVPSARLRPLLVLCLLLAPCQSPGATDPVRNLREQLRQGSYAKVEVTVRALLNRAALVTHADSLAYADLLDILSESLRRGGKANELEAEDICRRSLEVKERILPPGDPEIATSLHNLGALYYARGDYKASLELLERALAIRESSLGPNDPVVASSLLLIASVRVALGQDATARQLVDRAVTIQEAGLAPDDPDLGWGLNSLAVLNFNAGDYAQAEPLQERALEIFQHAYGRDHVMVGTCLHNLAALLYAMGDYRDSKEKFERALRIREHALGSDHAVVAYTLCGLAMDLEALHDYEGARSRYERAMRIQERAFGKDHDEVGWTLMRLGELDLERRDPAEAKALFRRGLENMTRGLGPEHPNVAEALVGLAVATGATGDSARAKQDFERALEIQRSVLGESHPEVGVTLSRYARFLSEAGDTAGALDAALRADAIFREHLRLTCRSLPERRALGFAASRTPGRDLALGIIARAPRQSPDILRRAWDAVLRSRAMILDEMAARSRLVGDLARRARTLQEARDRLANLLVRGASDDTPEHYRSVVDRARDQAEEAERSLAGVSATFRSDRARGEIAWEDVASSLPRRSALVAYAAYGEPPRRAYVAFCLLSGDATPQVIPIGRAVEVDALVTRWREEVVRAPRAGSDAEAETRCSRYGSALRQRVWDPVVPRLVGQDRVFIVPDGNLNLISWAALPAPSGGYLIESGPLIHLLSTERDLVRSDADRPARKGLLAFGAPSFDAAAFPLRPEGKRPAGASATRGVTLDCAEFAKVRFDSIPQSEAEVRDIASFWKRGEASVRVGVEADESSFKRLCTGVRVIHLATHGFFLTGPCVPRDEGERGIGGLALASREAPPEDEDVLSLSGLAFAGANRRGLAASESDDGILMADEVPSLDLSGVDWAVLSGCDTGLGEIRNGEGVFGLRRAFQIAGVSTVIMSLWPVGDAAARAWMEALYRNHLRRGLETAESVRAAYLDVLRERRAQRRSTHPFYWAAFVAAGDWK